MAWVVDTCVLLDIHCADPHFAQSSANCLKEHLPEGLIISPVTYVELAPAFGGNMKLQEQFLLEVGIEWPSTWILQDTMTAHRLWFSHIEKKRNGSASKRPIADVFISAFAQRFQGLITRNPKDFKGVQVVVS
ncbi:MAG: type II toxin-antitoxin system VapC family toxin [Verrucomicrobiota bacterium]